MSETSILPIYKGVTDQDLAESTIIPSPDEQELPEFPEVTALHYSLVDVFGDGNCGYYSMLLGLINQGVLPHDKLDDPKVSMIQL